MLNTKAANTSDPLLSAPSSAAHDGVVVVGDGVVEVVGPDVVGVDDVVGVGVVGAGVVVQFDSHSEQEHLLAPPTTASAT